MKEHKYTARQRKKLLKEEEIKQDTEFNKIHTQTNTQNNNQKNNIPQIDIGKQTKENLNKEDSEVLQITFSPIPSTLK